MQHPPATTAPQERPLPMPATDLALSSRALQGIAGLILLTVGSLALAWLLPDWTMLHFLWVAQVVPVLYLWLLWWGTQSATLDDDAS